jgi:hypothetical protein
MRQTFRVRVVALVVVAGCTTAGWAHAVTGLAGTAVSCGTSGVTVVLRPQGVQVLEYGLAGDGVWRPTGRVFAEMNASRAFTSTFCSRIKPKRTRLHYPNMAGPWPRRGPVETRVFCGAGADRTIHLQLNRVRSRGGRLIGNRLQVSRDGTVVVDVKVTRADGGISFAYLRCARNAWP